VPGFPIRTSTDPRLVGSSPWLIAASHVLLRLQAPRHPPLTLYNLENIDARARYGILKGRTTRRPDVHHQRTDRWWGAVGAGERRAHLQTGEPASRRRDGIAPDCSSSRIQRSLPQNGIVMPIAIPRAHRPHGRDIRRYAVRQGRGRSDSE
jgi:hypothetical protein